MSAHIAQQLIGRIWCRMATGTPFEECRAHEHAATAAEPEVWEHVDRHFAERAAHPADSDRSDA